MLDLANQRFGNLTAIEPCSINGTRKWKCQCDCGSIVYIITGQLNYGQWNSCGCRGQSDLTGQHFGLLTVIQKEIHSDKIPRSRQKGRFWVCICYCGRINSVAYCNLISGRTSSCGHHPGPRPERRVPTSAFKKVVNQYKAGARKRHLEFALTEDDLLRLFSGTCFYCEALPISTSRTQYSSFRYNGIDRKDNSKGYTLENSVTCCRWCNEMKWDHALDQFLNQIQNIYLHTAKEVIIDPLEDPFD